MKNVIIAFGNQKGGVGKTTLCTTFANYLVQNDIAVFVIDCDAQQTILKKRIGDLAMYNDETVKYKVQALDLSDETIVTKVMDKLRTIDGVILMDLPGNLSLQGLVPILVYSDYLVCPFQYEVTSINSTETFRKWVMNTKKIISDARSKLLFVPNMFDSRTGTKDEHESWIKTEKYFAQSGIVLPRIKRAQNMQRYSTIFSIKEIEDNVKPTFDKIYNLIFDKNHDTEEKI